MSAKYSLIPTQDPDSSAVDFGSDSAFTFTSGNQAQHSYRSYFTYASPQYRSAFTYSGGFDPHKFSQRDGLKPSLIGRICSVVITALSYVILVLTLPVSAWFAIRTIKQYERIVIYRIGKLYGTKGPGVVLVMPCIDRCTKVDMRTKAFSVPPQQILTGDGGIIEIGAEVFFRVQDPVLSVSSVQDLNHSTRIIAQTSMQKHFGKHELPDIQMDKAGIAAMLQADVNQMTLTWGVEVGKVELSPLKVLQQPPPNTSNTTALNALGSLLFPQGGGMPGIPGFPMPGQGGNIPGMPGFPMPGLVPQPTTGPAPVHAEAPSQPEAAASTCSSEGAKRLVKPAELVAAIRPFLNAALVKELNATYKFIVTGDNGGTFFLDLKHGDGQAGEGDLPQGVPDVTLTISVEDLQSLVYAEITAFTAYMTGRLQIDGDLKTATSLQVLLQQVADQLAKAMMDVVKG